MFTLLSASSSVGQCYLPGMVIQNKFPKGFLGYFTFIVKFLLSINFFKSHGAHQRRLRGSSGFISSVFSQIRLTKSLYTFDNQNQLPSQQNNLCFSLYSRSRKSEITSISFSCQLNGIVLCHWVVKTSKSQSY